jgi:hypothetical protein
MLRQSGTVVEGYVIITTVLSFSPLATIFVTFRLSYPMIGLS